MAIKLLLDDLCKDWHYDYDNLENIVFEVDGIEYKRKVQWLTFSGYISFKGNKYYFNW